MELAAVGLSEHAATAIGDRLSRWRAAARSLCAQRAGAQSGDPLIADEPKPAISTRPTGAEIIGLMFKGHVEAPDHPGCWSRTTPALARAATAWCACARGTSRPSATRAAVSA